MPDSRSEAEGGGSQAATASLLLDVEEGGAAVAGPTAAAAAAAADATAGALSDLLSLSDGRGAGATAPQPVAPVAASVATAAAAAAPLDLLGGLGALHGPPAPAAAAPTAAAAAPAAAPGVLAGLDDLLGGAFGGVAAAAQPSTPISLLPAPIITPQLFQSQWVAWGSTARSLAVPLAPAALAAVGANDYRDFTLHVGQANILSFATPRRGGGVGACGIAEKHEGMGSGDATAGGPGLPACLPGSLPASDVAMPCPALPHGRFDPLHQHCCRC